MKYLRTSFGIVVFVLLLCFPEPSDAGEFIKGLTIDCYPQRDINFKSASDLDQIVLKVNDLHRESKFEEVLDLLKSSIDTTSNSDDRNRLKYLYLFKLNQYGRWLAEASELISIADEVDGISNDTIRLYLTYYLLKFDLKQLAYPVNIFIREENDQSLEQTFSELISEAVDLKLYELSIQLMRLLNSKDILKPELRDVFKWDLITEQDSFGMGRLGYVPFLDLDKSDTSQYINTGLRLMNSCPSWDQLQRFQYAVQILKFSVTSGNDSVYYICQEQCLQSMEVLQDFEVGYHYYTTLSDLSDFFPEDVTYNNLLKQNKVIHDLQKQRSHWRYKEETISNILNTYSTINFQKRMMIILSVLLVMVLFVVALLYVLLFRKNQKIKYQNKLLAGLISSVSHDVRMPIRQCINELEESSKNIDEIKYELKKVESFIDEISISIKTRRFNKQYKLHEIISETLELYKSSIIRNHLTVNNNIDSQGQDVLLPSQHFNIVIRNLLLNAIEHNPSNGIINISSTARDNKISLVIENSIWGETNANEIKGLGLALIDRIMQDQDEFVGLEKDISDDKIAFKLIWTIN